MKPLPPEWPRISSAIYYDNASEAIDWLCRAFGFEVRIRIEGEGGRIEHSELEFGEGLVMVGESSAGSDKYPWRRSPAQVDGINTQNMMVYVDDIDAHFQRASAAGATIHAEIKTTDYGEDYWEDRGYECADIGGHHWWFYQRMRNPKAKD